MNNQSVSTLSEAYESARNLTKFYFSKLDDSLYTKRHRINDTEMNSAFWMLAHLVWTEHLLIIKGIGNQEMGIEWLDNYSYGTDPGSITSEPSLEEVRDKFDEVHLRAMEILKSMDDKQLEEDNHIDANFGSSKSKKNVLIHAIRHEPMHVGQLSLILKANGIKLT
ncbi:MAG: DinB family protein [Bacteroidetes bacterium]|nr:DinB family protein [Bacteroidota bacterium]